MNQIEKFIQKLEREVALRMIVVLCDIAQLNIAHLDVKKLQGFKDLYRVRTGKIRIVFRKAADQGIIIAIEFRGKVYREL